MEQKTVRDLLGAGAWARRMAEIGARVKSGPQSGRLAAQKFAAECAIEKARRGIALAGPEAALVELAARVPDLYEALSSGGRERLAGRLEASVQADETLMPVLHMMHVAGLQQARGFEVDYSGLEDAAPFDLMIRREGAEAEIACEAMSAEDGRSVNRSLWTRLIDRIDPDLQTWLAAHPGRYLLKMTLPKGLREEAGNLPALHRRINAMLAAAKRADYDEAAILRLDPLLLAGAQAGDQPRGMMARLRQEFGREAHFAVTEAGQSLFVMAARGGMQDEVAASIRRRLAAMAPARLSGARPGILAIFLEDTDRLEWAFLRDRLMLEGEVRNFHTLAEARSVVAVSCATRFELVEGGDIRFRNPMHPAAKSAALGPAVVSTN